MLGKTISHYLVLDELGQGGMGCVYRAEDTRLKRHVALKLLPPELSASRRHLERLRQEAQTLASLSHPNIVTVFSVERDDHQWFLTMELVEGETLGDRIPGGGMPLERFFDVAIPLADALAAAHARGVIHRDLKPSNIMVARDGAVKVLDFGLAKSEPESTPDGLSELPTASLTAQRRVPGTLPYMSPEQVQGRRIDHRSDLFSLGSVLYEMATGRRPFRGEKPVEIASAILRDTPTAITELRRELPEQLGRIIRHCLERDRRHRFQTALDVRNELQDLQQELMTRELLAPLAAARAARSKTGRWMLAGAVLGLLALIAAGLLFLSPQRREPLTPVSIEGVGAPAHARPLLAVLHFQNLTGNPELDWLRVGLADMLTTNLSQIETVRVLDTARLQQILDQLPAADHETEMPAVAQSVARRSGADAALLGSFAEVGPTLRVNLRLQDVASGEILVSERVETESGSHVFQLVDELSGRLRQRLEPASDEPPKGIRTLEEVTTSSLEAFRYYSEGSHLLDRGAAQEAILLLEKAVELDGEFAMAWTELAVAEMTGGSQSAGERAAARAVELGDRLTARERLYIQGVYNSLRPQTLLDAVDSYQELLRRFPDHHAGRGYLARLFYALERWNEAIPHYELLRDQGVESAATHVQLAGAYASIGQFERARGALDAYLDRHPESVVARFGRVTYLIGRERFAQALAELETIEQLEPGQLRLELLRWTASVLTGDLAAADLAADRLAGSSSRYFQRRGHLGHAITALYRGRLDHGLEALERAAGVFAEGDPETGRTRLYRAWMWYQAGAPDRALALARNVAEAPWQDYNLLLDSRLLLALAQARLGRPDDAARELREVHRLYDLYPRELVEDDRYMADGLVAVAAGQHAAAIGPLTEAAERVPVQFGRASQDTVLIWSGLATAHRELGRDSDALPWLERLARSRVKRVNDPILYVRNLYWLARALERQGRLEEARAHYREFLEYWRDGTIDRDKVEDALRRLG